MIEDIHNHGFFQQYEVGAIDDEEFRKSLCKLAKTDLDDKHLDEAWNSMLGDVPQQRIEWIEEMVTQYNVVILSNTNALHIVEFNKLFNNTTKYNLPEDLFHKVYYSHVINDRKPNRSCFQYVLDDFGMDPSKTVFYDDNTENINAATQMGINTVLVKKNSLTREQLPNGRK